MMNSLTHISKGNARDKGIYLATCNNNRKGCDSSYSYHRLMYAIIIRCQRDTTRVKISDVVDGPMKICGNKVVTRMDRTTSISYNAQSLLVCEMDANIYCDHNLISMEPKRPPLFFSLTDTSGTTIDLSETWDCGWDYIDGLRMKCVPDFGKLGRLTRSRPHLRTECINFGETRNNTKNARTKRPEALEIVRKLKNQWPYRDWRSRMHADWQALSQPEYG